ncbi:flavin-containing monooxygenase [Sphingomonas profundi]|uniref:flavin-containing monooxygenase n=1 Tax=Alterirhizorhabdus profundi TaxID=2681549 RepID=UPI001E2D84F0|nr:NAD(P)/FAD-dependent oxidoreductase [Sphingomonas profundi]
MAEPPTIDAVVIGAGFGGLYMVHRLRELGFSVQGFEAAADLGGVWYWNNYPGARCDGESLAYSYSFSDALQQDWSWSERYGGQPEILRYLNAVADRFDLRRLFRFSTRVLAARWDEDAARWIVETDDGGQVAARFLISASGCLSAARVPDFPGMETFSGESYHTGQWPKEPVDFAGKRVAVVGTGSSGIQIVTAIAPEVASLTVFQRTPNFSVPARNRSMDRTHEARVKADYRGYRDEARGLILPKEAGKPASGFNRPPMGSGHDFTAAEREAELLARWNHGYGGAPLLFAFRDMMTDPEINEFAADFVRARIRETVADPATAELLSPKGYPLGAKRICVDTGYYETFNRDNVALVDVKADPIERITPSGIMLASGRAFAVDTIVFATGYDAMTGALSRIDIRGRNGQRLRDKWAEGPRAYLGLMAAGFPNLFLMTGPGSPSVISNVVDSLEQHADLIGDALTMMRAAGHITIEPERDAEDRWVAHVDDVANTTLWPRAASWYKGCNIPGKPQVFMVYVGGPAAYRRICDEVKADGWRGFRLAGQAPAREPARAGAR